MRFMVKIGQFLIGLSAVILVQSDAYNISRGVFWGQAQTTMFVDIAGGNGLWKNAFKQALEQWNQATQFSFSVLDQFRDPCDSNDNLNGVGWKEDDCGDSFGSALAVTHLRWNSRTLELLQADLVFNSNKDWDVYQGNLQISAAGKQVFDFKRVALHEIGHAIGLGHVDQSSNSIMVPITTNLDAIQQDDINGIAALYSGLAPNKAPVAAFSALPAEGTAPFTVSLDGSAATDPDGKIQNYDWMSSDGQKATGKTAQLTFNLAGNYTITLLVTDNKGTTASASKPILVNLSSNEVVASYDSAIGLAILKEVKVLDRTYYAELKLSADNSFSVQNLRELSSSVLAKPALYDDTLHKLTIPEILVSEDHRKYSVELVHNGDLMFRVQNIIQLP